MGPQNAKIVAQAKILEKLGTADIKGDVDSMSFLWLQLITSCWSPVHLFVPGLYFQMPSNAYFCSGRITLYLETF